MAGRHEEVLVVRADGTVKRLDTIDLGFMVGLVEDISEWVRHREIHLQVRDGIVLYTDGITEAHKARGEMFGIECLCEIVSLHWHSPASVIQRAAIHAVRLHLGEDAPLDDITLVVIKQK